MIANLQALPSFGGYFFPKGKGSIWLKIEFFCSSLLSNDNQVLVSEIVH